MTASAASLGGLSARGLGANSTMVVACDGNGVAISYLNEFDFTTETYRTVEVGLGDLASACEGLRFRLTLASPTAAVREITGTINLAGGTRHALTISPLDRVGLHYTDLIGGDGMTRDTFGTARRRRSTRRVAALLLAAAALLSAGFSSASATSLGGLRSTTLFAQKPSTAAISDSFSYVSGTKLNGGPRPRAGRGR